MLLPGEDFGRDPPPGDVGRLNYWLQLLRQTLKNRPVLFGLEEALAPVVFPKHRYFRPLDDFADFLAQLKRALERGELAVNCRRRRLLALPVCDVTGDPIARYVHRQVLTEESK